MSDFRKDFKKEFVDVIIKQHIPFHTLSGKTINNATIDPEDDKSESCVPLAGKAFGTLNKNYKVVLSPDVSKTFRKIKLKASTINYLGSEQEIGFLLIGQVKADKSIEIYGINVYQIGYRAIHFDEQTTKKIDSIIEFAKNRARLSQNKPFVIFGHTHPEQRQYPNFLANSWSLGDLWSSFCASDRYKNDLQIADLLITPSLDTNLMFYDRGEINKNWKGFYRFAEGVYETDKDGNVEKINSCYSDYNKAALRLNPETWNEDILTR